MHLRERRQRVHEIVLALIQGQKDLELVDPEAPSFDGTTRNSTKENDPARWLERNRRILKQYQSLVRSAITLDALIDSEHCEP